MSAIEKKLGAAGYSFTGIYTRDKEEAKRRAKELRDAGTPARVVSKFYPGRCGQGTMGYSVYAKEKKP